MDQEPRDNPRISENSGQFNENSSNSVNGVVLETLVVINSEQNACLSDGNADLGLENDEFGSSKALLEAQKRVVNQEMQNEQRIGENMGQVDQRSSGNSNNSVHGVVLETVIVINSRAAACVSGENRELGMKGDDLGSTKATVEKPKTKVGESVKESCVIDMKRGGGGGGGFKDNLDGERVCRICHLSSEQSLDATDTTTSSSVALDLIQLGCACKDELGIAHAHCAEAWFKLRGNRVCEICGQTAKNITGVGDNNRYMEELHEWRFTVSSSSSSDGGRRCWRGHPFCNFLMACLVIAFILPWFFRVNMF